MTVTFSLSIGEIGLFASFCTCNVKQSYARSFQHLYECVLSKLQLRTGVHKIFFLFLHENICCGYSLEVPQ